MYYAYWMNQTTFTPGKILCVARNYRDHAKEMGSDAPSEPVFFLKPRTSIVPDPSKAIIPSWTNDFQHEIELVVRIGRMCRNCTAAEAVSAIDGVAVGIDFTARDMQQRRKQAGMPWEQAKAFDGACLLSPFVGADALDLSALDLELSVNGVVRQQGNSSQMVHDIPALIAAASRYFTLEENDLIMTGTPAGVGRLEHGDRVVATIAGVGALDFAVVDEGAV